MDFESSALRSGNASIGGEHFVVLSSGKLIVEGSGNFIASNVATHSAKMLSWLAFSLSKYHL